MSMMSFFYANLNERYTLEGDCGVCDDDLAAALLHRGDADVVVFATCKQKGNNVAVFGVASSLDLLLESFENLVI